MIEFTFTVKCKIFLFSMLLLLRLSLAVVYLPTGKCPFSSCRGDYYSSGSALEENLNVVLNSLVENVNKTGYNISWYGPNGDMIYGLAQCRGDLNAPACGDCVSEAKTKLRQLCSTVSGSIYHGNGCFLRYATQNFYSELSYESIVIGCNKTASSTGDESTANVLEKVVNDAVSSNVGFGTGKGSGIYALAQCWRDLSSSLCKECLNYFYGRLQGCEQGQSFSYNCMIRYEEYMFYNEPAPSPSPSPSTGTSPSILPVPSPLPIPVPRISPSSGLSKPPSSSSGNSIPPSSSSGHSIQPSSSSDNSIPPSSDHSIPPSSDPPRPSTDSSIPQFKRKIHHSNVGLVLAGLALVLLLVGLLIWKRKVIQRLWKKPLPDHFKSSFDILTTISKSKLHYKFQTLQIATNNFSLANKLGQGGFGSVFKGILSNGTEIAVKRLFSNKEHSVSDFFNEVNIISNVQHKNLIKLLGFSMDGIEKLLVYEYLPNKSLDHFLFDENMGKLLDWQKRFQIILGIAGGLAYLHQESDTCIIHRDIKASNILLDQHFKPKIADFGLVRHFAEDQTHLSTSIIGTRGYMAPEYLVHGNLTEKVDVYAFGVLVLEIITGKRIKTPMDDDGMPYLLTMVWKNYLSGTLSNVIDPNIKITYEEEVMHVVHVAFLCTQVSAKLRPSMSKVIIFLTTKNISLPVATQPPFVIVDLSQSNASTSVATIS